ncbi:unnamed protein product [Linum trigynum]|uniref:Ribosomal protein S10 domain-containing protein n=1 Tax=Linum trigynum TaxID=586398 RepID=A0AAV2DDD1_9ROSI
MATYAAIKPAKAGLEEPQEQTHKIRITLSSKNVKNLETVCGDLIRGLRTRGSLLVEKVPTQVVKQITSITIEPGVEVEVTIADS